MLDDFFRIVIDVATADCNDAGLPFLMRGLNRLLSFDSVD
jgi:hypothetical protein